MTRTIEGILAEVRPIRSTEELRRIAGEIQERTAARRAEMAKKQKHIAAQVEIGRRRGRQRRVRETAVLREISERVKAQRVEQQKKSKQPQKVTIEDRLREASRSTRNLD